MNHVTVSPELFHGTTLAPGVGRRTTAEHLCLGRASAHERLLCGGLRHDLGFLVSHFWLLSEAFASFVLVFTSSVSGTRRAGLVNRMRSLRSLFGELLDRTNREPVVAVVVAIATVF